MVSILKKALGFLLTAVLWVLLCEALGLTLALLSYVLVGGIWLLKATFLIVSNSW